MSVKDLVRFVQNNNLNEVQKLAASNKEMLFGYNFSIDNEIRQSDRTMYSNFSEFPLKNLGLIHVAAFYDATEVFLYLLDQQIDKDTKSGNDFRPIHYACMGGAVEVTSILCEMGSDVNSAPPALPMTPLFCATYSGSHEILEILFEYGAILPTGNPGQPLKYSPIDRAVRSKDDDSLVVLISHGLPIRADEKEYTPLMRAVAQKYFFAIPLLIKHGSNVSYCTSDKKSAFYLACLNTRPDIAKILIENGANMKCSGPHGLSPVHMAAQTGDLDLVQTVIQCGADPFAVDNQNRTTLFSAAIAKENRFEIINYLLDLGVDPNKVDKRNSTMIISLIVGNNNPLTPEQFLHLLNRGVDLDIVCGNKHTIAETIQKVAKEPIKKALNQFLQQKLDIQRQKHEAPSFLPRPKGPIGRKIGS